MLDRLIFAHLSPRVSIFAGLTLALAIAGSLGIGWVDAALWLSSPVITLGSIGYVAWRGTVTLIGLAAATEAHARATADRAPRG